MVVGDAVGTSSKVRAVVGPTPRVRSPSGISIGSGCLKGSCSSCCMAGVMLNVLVMSGLRDDHPLRDAHVGLVCWMPV